MGLLCENAGDAGDDGEVKVRSRKWEVRNRLAHCIGSFDVPMQEVLLSLQLDK